MKPNSLFRFRSHEKAFPVVVADAIETGIPLRDCSLSKDLHASANRDMQKSNTESLQVLNGRGVEKQEQNLLSFEGAFHDCNKHSVTELLECLQEKSGRAQGNSEIVALYLSFLLFLDLLFINNDCCVSTFYMSALQIETEKKKGCGQQKYICPR